MVIKGAETHVRELFPQLKADGSPGLPEELTFIHAEDILAMYPDLPRKQRETELVKKFNAVFIYGIGWTLKDGYPHEMRPPTTMTGSPRQPPKTADRCMA